MKTYRVPRPARMARPLAGVLAVLSLAGGGSLLAAGTAEANASGDLARVCGARPSAANTGTYGGLTRVGPRVLAEPGQRLDNARVVGDLTVSADDVVVHNVAVTGTLTVLGNGADLDHVSGTRVVISGASRTTVQYSNLTVRAGDAVLVTADRGPDHPVNGLSMLHNYVHRPSAPTGQDGYAGTHVRAGSGIRISCSRYDAGPGSGAALFLEDANGGTRDVSVAHSWLGGGGFTVLSGAQALVLDANVFDRTAQSGVCSNTSGQPVTARANRYTNGVVFAPCASNPAPTPSPTGTPTPSPTGTPTPSGACQLKPSAANTGASGTLTPSGRTVLTDGEVLQNASVASLEIRGVNVSVRNVSVAGNILVRGDNALLDHVTAQGVAISSASGATVQYANIGFGEEDGLHVTSDSGSYIQNASIRYNFVHDPRVSPGSHYDGIQVRGASNSTIACNTFDPGPYQDTFNAAVYLEDANGGEDNVTVRNNWLVGFAFSVMMDARNVTLSGNQLSGDIHWRECYVGTGVGNPGLRSSGNTRDGAPVSLCQ